MIIIQWGRVRSTVEPGVRAQLNSLQALWTLDRKKYHMMNEVKKKCNLPNERLRSCCFLRAISSVMVTLFLGWSLASPFGAVSDPPSLWCCNIEDTKASLNGLILLSVESSELESEVLVSNKSLCEVGLCAAVVLGLYIKIIHYTAMLQKKQSSETLKVINSNFYNTNSSELPNRNYSGVTPDFHANNRFWTPWCTRLPHCLAALPNSSFTLMAMSRSRSRVIGITRTTAGRGQLIIISSLCGLLWLVRIWLSCKNIETYELHWLTHSLQNRSRLDPHISLQITYTFVRDKQNCWQKTFLTVYRLFHLQATNYFQIPMLSYK